MTSGCDLRLRAVAVIAALLTAWLTISPSLRAQDASTTSQGTEFRRIYVPEDELSRWIAGGEWEPVASDEFERLIDEQKAVSPEPSPAGIARANYAARFEGGALTEGTFEWEVANSGDRREVVSLDPLNLHASKVTSAGQSATWGTTSDGRTVLLADNGKSTVAGHWTLKGKRRHNSVEFDVRVAPATVSRLQIDLPADRSLQASVGDVTRSSLVQADGYATWTLELGSSSTCRLRITKTAATAEQRATLLFQSDTWYSVREEGLQLQSRLDLEVANGEIDSFAFVVAPGVDVFSVTHAGESPLSWKSDPAEEGTRIVVQLPTPLRERSRPLRTFVNAVAPLEQGREWELPAPKLDDAVFVSGQVHLKIRKPLVLRSFEGVDFRQTSMLTDADGETLTFQQNRPDARLAVLVDLAETRLTARTLAVLNLQAELPLLKLQCRLEARTGSAFETSLAIPRGWDVVSASLVDDSSDSNALDWHMEEHADESRMLHVELFDPVVPENPKTIEIDLRKRAPIAPVLQLPTFDPVDCCDVRSVLVVKHSPATSLTLERAVNFTEVDAENAPEFVKVLPLWSDVEIDEELAKLVLASGEGEAEGVLKIDRLNVGDAADSPSTQRDVADNGDSVDRNEEVESPGYGVASLRLESILAGESGADVHDATFVVESAEPDRLFHFDLAAAAELISVNVNGAAARVSQKDGRYAVPLERGNGRDRVTIRYQMPATMLLVWQNRPIAIPQTDYKVIHFSWNFAFPPDIRLVAEPSQVDTAGAVAVIGMMERFFGPLGRSAEARIFNPLAASSWREVFARNPQRGMDTPASETRGDEAAFSVPVGWTVRRATAIHAPELLQLRLWSYGRVTSLAWVATLGCLIAGFVWRTRRRKFGRWMPALWVSVCLVAAWQLPAAYALVVGGCLSGTLIAVAVPVTLVGRIRSHRRSIHDVPIGSTVTESKPIVAAPGLLWFIAVAAFAAAGAWAQPPSAEDATEKGATDERRSVIVPVDDQQKPSSLNVVYVPRELLSRLQQSIGGNDTSDYLITSAEYQVAVETLDSARIEARYDIAVLSGAGVTRVSFPITNAYLDGADACVVNGEPTPVLPVADGNGFMVELRRAEIEPAETNPSASGEGEPIDSADGSASSIRGYDAVAHFEVVLQLRPPVKTGSDGGSFRIGIPQTASCRVSASVPETVNSFAILSADHEVLRSQSRGVESVALGAAEAFVLRWSAGEQPQEPNRALEARIRSTVEAHPTRLEYRYRVAYKLLRGQVSGLSWRVPQAFVLRNVQAPGLLSTSQTTIDADHSRLVLEFSEPISEEVEIEATFTLPARGEGNVLSIPVPRLIEESGEGEEIEVESNRIGILTTADYKLTSVMSDDNDASRISPDLLFEGDAAQSGATTLQYAYQIQQARTLKFELVPVTPARKVVQQNLTGVIKQGVLAWTFQAELEMTAGEAFQHLMTLDPRVSVQSASVLESGTERLERWSQVDGELVLFLRDKTSGVQNITLNGTMPLPTDEETELPAIELRNAQFDATVWVLYRSRHASVDVIGAEQLDRGEASDGQPSDGEQPLVGRFRVAATSDPPQIRVGMSARGRRVDTAGILERISSDTWRLTNHLHIQSDGSMAPSVDIRVPAELVESFEIEPTPVEPPNEPLPDGSVIVRVPLEGERSSQSTATVRAVIPAPVGEVWEIPAITVANSSGGENYLLVDGGDGFITADLSITELGLDSVPGWAASLIGDREAADDMKVFRTEAAPFRLLDVRSADDGNELRVAQLHTQVWLDVDGRVRGCTEIYIPSRGPRSLELRVPAGVSIDALFSDGRAAAISEEQSRSVVVPLDDARATAHVVVAYWRHRLPAEQAGVRVVSEQWLRPADTDIENSIVAFVMPEGHRLVARDGFERIRPVEYLAARLDALLAIGQADTNGGGRISAMVAPVADRVGKYFTARMESESDDGAVSQTEAARLERELKRFESARDQQRAQSVSRGDISPVLTQSLVDSTGVLRGRPVLGRLNGQDENDAAMSYWVIDESLVAIGLGIAGFVVLLPIAVVAFGWGVVGWLERHEGAAWLLLAVFWWICLAPSVLGFGLLVVVSAIVIRRRTVRAVATVPH